MIHRRLARLESASAASRRGYVVNVNPGETTEEAVARFFAPFGDERWPVMVAPTPCTTAEEWFERYAPIEMKVQQ